MKNTLALNDLLVVNRLANSFSTGQIVYFHIPNIDSNATKNYTFQRIIALPGDSLEIFNKNVLLNNKILETESSFQSNYYIKSYVKLDGVFEKKFNLQEGGEISNDLDYSYSLTKSMADSLKKKHNIIKSITQKTEQKGGFDETIFPHSIKYNWNMDFFGKVKIPAMNDELKLDSTNLILYANLIRYDELNTLEVNGDSIIINGVLTNTYLVKNNYYFEMGDNRDNAIDSRSFCYLSESRKRGKVISVFKRN
jgi:signal peptidase I